MVSCERRGLLTNRGRLGTPPVFGGVHVANLFRFLCCVFVVVCLHPVSYVPGIDGFSRLSMSYVPGIDGFSRLSILHCSFGFLCHLFSNNKKF